MSINSLLNKVWTAVSGNSGSGTMSTLISPEQFQRTLEACDSHAQPEQFPRLLTAISQAGISSRGELAMFLANIYHESAMLLYVSEISPQPDDFYTGGAKYKGRGYIQLTHDYNYRDASEALYGDDTLVKNPEMVEKDLGVAWAVTAWFWKARVKPGLNLNDFNSTVRAINSMELDGHHEEQLGRRKRYHEAIKGVLLGTGPLAFRKSGPGPGHVHTGGAGEITHAVQPGEFLWAIGQKYGVDFNQIARDNNIANPSVIHPGTRLKIRKAPSGPPVAPSLAPSANGSHTSSATSGGNVIYTVQPGDYLWAIGQKFGVDYNKIARDNNIANPSVIHPGMKLIITKGDAASGSSSGSSGDASLSTGESGHMIYTVQPGDYLWAIGQTFGVDFNQIAKDNNIANPSVIHPGMKLTIKKASHGAASGPQGGSRGGHVNVSAPHSGNDLQEYTVQPGDYLWAIGQKYGVDYNKIARDNNIANPSIIHPGMKLIIRK
ncbi:hypothetical protein RvY_11277 [Ramazzottius varieornatus]|uniref:LysM domain-containing protein n=1 Tax=Ramazzottius varieornatus TaxID=947166 RepID=A0A1D1VPG4_RAMVA|nr:hypothetical protein RvY_11277 [Ramazzottius varieornatus]